MPQPLDPPESVAAQYEALVSAGTIEADAAQAALADRLDRLNERLAGAAVAPKPGRFGRLLGRKAPAAPGGIYIHGPVGRGKTMLMDLFFPLAVAEPKRRLHFHEFMAEAHEGLKRFRDDPERNRRAAADPVAPLADAIASQSRLLCFDEFAVNDIGDAMILGRLFSALFARGVTIVATSNVPPDLLYKDGLNRGHFLPFIAELKERMEVVELDARTDFRLEKLAGAPVYVVPDGPEATARLDETWRRLTGGARGGPMKLPAAGRTIEAPRVASGVARFRFEELCKRPLGPSDYLTIARRFHTVMIDGIETMSSERRDVARRFITLVDALYDQKVKLVASAADEPDRLYRGRGGAESFEFARTASRLTEMRSAEYLALPHG